MPRPDPYLKAYIEATTAFDRMVRVTPARMAAFVEAKIGDRESVHSSEINVDTIEELLVFRSLPGVSDVDIGDTRFRVVPDRGRTDNAWINLKSFRIERVEPSGPS